MPSLDELNRWLAPMGLAVAVPLGFNNTYALAMRGEDARAKGITRLSDLKRRIRSCKLGLSHEFLGRNDGWPGLAGAYELPFATPRGLDHGLAYEAIAGGQVDVIDIYSTDAKLGKFGLTVLDDDRRFFPRYDAVLLYRADMAQRFPRTLEAFRKLDGSIDAAAMDRDERSRRARRAGLRRRSPQASSLNAPGRRRPRHRAPRRRRQATSGASSSGPTSAG